MYATEVSLDHFCLYQFLQVYHVYKFLSTFVVLKFQSSILDAESSISKMTTLKSKERKGIKDYTSLYSFRISCGVVAIPYINSESMYSG